ncbi:MAG: carbon-nitrogen hydrolase [Acidimicrobiaceae bacterium]|nr:carbon-nitrogen hydrolase [Acidimicrobiaceae bacterium]
MPDTHGARDHLRVAATQFAVGTDVDAHLGTCVRMLDEAASAGAELVVLPEFCNHLSVYDSAEHCRAMAVPLDGDWLGTLARRAAHHRMYAALAVTVPRAGGRVTVTRVLIAPDGRITATADKQMLMGNERAFLSAGERPAAVAGTVFGPVGLYACMDGVTFETPRALAVSGARLLCNSLNSFARDEASLHVPVRAAENGVWVAAANKVGSLLPDGRAAEFAEALGVPAEALEGAGESQIVDPDGTVVAKAPPTGEAVVVADIDLSHCRPQRLAGRRPLIYGPLAGPDTAIPATADIASVTVAGVPGAQRDPELISDALQPPELIGEAFSAGAGLVVLPELTPVPDGIPAGVLVVTTAERDGQHVGQVWTAGGLVHEQPQIHHSDRYPDVTRLGEGISLYPTSFGDMAVIVGDDHRHPETIRLAAVAGAHLVAVCWQPEHRWECDLGLVERAAENRVSLAACAPPGPLASTMLLDPPADSLWNPHRSSPFDGTINNPVCTVAGPDDGLLVGTLHPARAANRAVSKDTDLVGGRSLAAASVLAQRDPANWQQ